MSDVVIKVENLSKKYIISHLNQERYTALRDVVTNGAKNLGKKVLAPFTSSAIQQRNNLTEDFYALRDVSFEIKQGDRIGIIGRNGAGKSTLLKILSRITEPTSGRIEITGRVASLLEVGTGFHPELTGRENIFLNGAILGMGKAEIKRKFDEIVDFAEVERFLDTPVKRYSSGMYVRLAFAVAAHLEPEILIVDEVLAVGDAQFQKKCLGKMESVGKEGRTVLFVSHNMGAIKRLCDRSFLLRAGNLDFDGTTEKVIGDYLSVDRINSASEKIWPEGKEPGDDSLKLKAVRISNPENKFTCELKIEEPIIIEIELNVIHKIPEALLSIFVINSEGVIVLHTCDVMSGQSSERKVGSMKLCCEVPAYCLNSGKYSLDVASDIPFQKTIFYEKDLLSWEVLGTCDKMGRYGQGAWKGLLGPGIVRWSTMESSGYVRQNR